MLKKINIMGVDYKIKYVDKVNDEDGWGQIDNSTTTIRINSSLSKQNIYNTLLHEITHCLLYKLGKPKLSSKEDFVEAFSNAIFDTLSRNKLLKNKYNGAR